MQPFKYSPLDDRKKSDILIGVVFAAMLILIIGVIFS
jgi:hypothetical protein